MANYLVPRDSREIQNKIVSFLETNLTDPYEQATGKTRTNFVYGDDFKLVAMWPKIHVDISDFTPNKIATQGKTTFMEEEEHHFMIYYYNQKAHKYTFADNGLTLQDEAQCRKYLQYIRDTIKENATEFNGYCNNITFGTIPKPIFHNASRTFVSFIPMIVYTYRR